MALRSAISSADSATSVEVAFSVQPLPPPRAWNGDDLAVAG